MSKNIIENDEIGENYYNSLKTALENGAKYKVETISLNDMLELHNAPLIIDYLSIDTEGSEYEILSCLDFELYYTKTIEKIKAQKERLQADRHNKNFF